MEFDFPLIMVIAVFVTGALSLFDRLVLAPKRKQAVATLANQGVTEGEAVDKVKQVPYLVDNAKSIFPVLFWVLVIRSFLFEPFQIPSGSMIPTLQIGDFILVNKYDYGLRLPVTGTEIIPVGKPQRGDVMVFKQPGNENVNFIKRVVGLPGDVVRYQNKQLTINGESVADDFVAELNDGTSTFKLYNETLGEHSFQIRKENTMHDVRAEGQVTVPKGMYFVMGDNRDRSSDSRYWGFVPDANIVGKAVYVWMHWPSWGDIPSIKNNGAIP